MVDKFDRTQVDAKRSEYLHDLFKKALNGDVEAGSELSSIALGGFQEARDLVGQMDAQLSLKNKPAPIVLQK